MPNPSTVASGDEVAYHFHNSRAHNLRLSKADREYHLREARKLAEELGIEGPGPINGHSAEPTPKIIPVHRSTAKSLLCIVERDIERKGPAHSFMVNASRLKELLDHYFATTK